MGKTLLELRAEIDEQHKAVRTDTDQVCCISWQANINTLIYFHYNSGWPTVYWHGDDIENYTSIERFISEMKKYEPDSYEQYILDAPVWCVMEDDYHTVCRLLGDIPIEL
jgi:hypothetical protein